MRPFQQLHGPSGIRLVGFAIFVVFLGWLLVVGTVVCAAWFAIHKWLL